MSGKRMTRQEQIDNAIVGLSSEYMLCLRKRQYEVYFSDRIGKPVEPYDYDFAKAFETFPTWEEAVINQRPYLANDEVFKAHWEKMDAPLTDEERAKIQAERDKYPSMASVYMPVTDKHKLLVPGFRYSDGRVSRAMMTNPEWEALSEEERRRLSIPFEMQDEREADVLLDADEVG